MLRRVLAAAVFASLAAAGGARAADVRFVSPQTGGTLDAGRLVDVIWTGLPSDVPEFELLLRIGDDPRATVRLTRSLVDGPSVYRWRVPNLPARTARLVLRGDVDELEVELASSEPFQIDGSAIAPLEEISFKDGELWAASEPAPPLRDELTGGSSERVEEGRADDSPAEAPRGSASAVHDPRSEPTLHAALEAAPPPASRLALVAFPRFVPRRN